MRYHDMKIRDAKKLTAISAAGAAVFLIGLCFRSEVEPLINRLPPLRSGEPYFHLMLAFGTLVLLCLGAAVWYLRTSPAQNAEYLHRMRRKGREIPEQFDWTLLDESDPDFHVNTWQYLRGRKSDRR